MASSAICILLTLPRFVAQEHFTFTSRCGVMLTRLTVADVKLPELLLLLLLTAEPVNSTIRWLLIVGDSAEPNWESGSG